MDAIDFYDHSISRILHIDGIEMWHGHPNLYMKWLQGILKTPDDSDIGFLV